MTGLRGFCLPRAVALAAAIAFAPCSIAKAETAVNIGVVNDFAGWNPYADSTSQMYMIWCQTYGCLGIFNTNSGEYEPLLAESWETDKADPRIWYFHLRHGLKRHHDGKELTAADVVHSIDRTKHDPHTAQVNNVHPIKSVEATDKYTVKVTTTEPTAPLLDFIFGRVIITGKDLFEKNGAGADRKTPYGWGPYMISDISIGQGMVVTKNPDWPGIKPTNPDRIMFRRIKEAEPRITALLNGEIQIAMAIPPHLAQRVEAAKGVKAVGVPSTENMFLAMNPHFKPWDNKKLRQAVGYAIDREAIVKSVFQGRAEVLDGPIGPGQYGYSPDVKPKYHYDPERAKQLLKEAGFPNGLDVELFASTDRYVNDRQSSEAIAAMLTKVGIRTKLNMRDYSIEWPNVRRGRVPFYYQGRGSVIDPSPMIEQYFQTGVTPRIGYSNPELDKLLNAERREFDPAKRKALLLQAFNIIQEEAPAFFLWRINSVYGISDKVTFKPHSDERIFGFDIEVK
jgi:peptide/nickel transport system substrate-binding protein